MRPIPVGDPTPADLRKEIRSLWDAIDSLTKRANEMDSARFSEKEILFSYPGEMVVGSYSPVYHVRWPTAYITEVRLSAVGTPANTDSSSIFEITVNGTSAESLVFRESVEGGPHAVLDNLMIEVEEWDKIGVAVTSAITGLTDVTIQVTLMVPEGGSE